MRGIETIVVDPEGVIIVDHTRWKAARKRGLKQVPVHVASGGTLSRRLQSTLALALTFGPWRRLGIGCRYEGEEGKVMEGDNSAEHLPLSGSGGAGVPAPAETPPEIEGYKVTGLLGSGGMSTVWRAVQQSTRREVALKVLSWGLSGVPRARRRFEREVELASRLAHPHIARVYESGLYHGAYYYAMEVVEGRPLDEYVEHHRLDRRHTLELVRTVCRAVQHAHQRGVIHRDLKPSNILVTEDGQPHVLDFGLAKAVLEGGAALTVSVAGDVLGTPAYMSPEQAAGKNDQVDTRSDVYSLGVMLFRLLTGAFPHDLAGDRQQVLRRIAEEEPRRPRAAAEDIDKDLEALLLKALAKKPDDRYASAGDLRADIGRYLAGDPLSAKPPTLGYFLYKRLRKHRAAVAISCGVLLAMGTMAVVSYVRIAQARDEARQEAAKARTVTNFFNETLTPDDPQGADGREVTVHRVLEKAAGQIEAKFSGQPLLEAEIRQCLGTRYLALRDYEAAHTQTSLALDLWQRHLGKDHPNTLAAMHQLANVLPFRGKSHEAEQLHREVLQARERILGKDNPDTLRSMSDLAETLADQEKYAEAEELARRALKAAGRALGQDHPETLASMRGLAGILWDWGRRDEAEGLYRQIVQIRLRLFGEENLATISSMRDHASALWSQGKRNEALVLFGRLVEVCRRGLGPDHPMTLRSAGALAEALTELAWHDEGGPTHQEEPDRRVGVSKKQVIESMAFVDRVANGLHGQGKYREAETLHRYALEVRRRVLGNEDADTLTAEDALADDLYSQGKYRDTEALQREVLEARRRVLGNEHSDTLASKERLANSLYWQGNYREAEPLYGDVVEGRQRSLGPGHPQTLRAMKALASTLEAQGEKAEAEAILRSSGKTQARPPGEAPTEPAPGVLAPEKHRPAAMPGAPDGRPRPGADDSQKGPRAGESPKGTAGG